MTRDHPKSKRESCFNMLYHSLTLLGRCGKITWLAASKTKQHEMLLIHGVSLKPSDMSIFPGFADNLPMNLENITTSHSPKAKNHYSMSFPCNMPPAKKTCHTRDGNPHQLRCFSVNWITRYLLSSKPRTHHWLA